MLKPSLTLSGLPLVGGQLQQQLADMGGIVDWVVSVLFLCKCQTELSVKVLVASISRQRSISRFRCILVPLAWGDLALLGILPVWDGRITAVCTLVSFPYRHNSPVWLTGLLSQNDGLPCWLMVCLLQAFSRLWGLLSIVLDYVGTGLPVLTDDYPDTGVFAVTWVCAGGIVVGQNPYCYKFRVGWLFADRAFCCNGLRHFHANPCHLRAVLRRHCAFHLPLACCPFLA